MLLRDQSFRIFYSPADDPLNNFYIPALSASVRYDRSAGFFSSTALAVAASGVARLIQNNGRMRLLVGASLDENDVAAIQQGYDLQTRVTERLLQHFPDPQDALLRARLEVMAWMIAEGTLEIKVVLPRDERGLPIPAERAQDYYHPKSGIFTDAQGDRVAFAGSVNESETAWIKNYETFSVYFSWNETKPYLEQHTINFERLWNGREKDWIALDIPVAVRERLLTFRPARAPTRDPLERAQPTPAKNGGEHYATDIPQSERILFQYLRDAPYLLNATALGRATSALTPWPHQARVADALIARFPDHAMLCDEVGLGKTIEAGLVLRQLLISGRIKRCLILAPKSVLKQWQEELYEKFALEIPRYESGKFWSVHGQQLDAPAGNPWDAFDVLIAGSQLAKREDRRQQVLAARGWDLLVVDEAHHARRKDFKEHIYRPNRLLGLLNDINAQSKAGSVLLMTATPMQVHPLEVWDLLTVLGLGGQWGADETNFLDFFAELRKLAFAEIDWERVFDLTQDYLATGGVIDPTFQADATEKLGRVRWSALEQMLTERGARVRTIRQLGAEAEPYIKELARRHTPLNHYVFRNTRALLREYQRRGLLRANVPTRQPRRERIAMTPAELELYHRIEEYITSFYQKYERERRGLGFIMTVYRRRLTSSFYAVRKSLERRLNFLRGITTADQAFDDDDLEQDDLEQDVAEELLSDADRERFRGELEYVQDFIHKLQVLGITETKLEHLKTELARVFRQRDTALVFTQYTDTMDYLRDQLQEVYGAQIACYSGRGGEIWNGIAWVPDSKENVKTKFRDGQIRILLCTESASEGLNLQTCGVLINYDMPWNPMRVEQRIGRIDRIGQKFNAVWVSNYFYRDTIEDLIYERLADRIDWFQVIVGDLQPILAEVGEATRRLAMLSPTERAVELERELSELRQRLQNRAVESLNLDNFLTQDDAPTNTNTPVTLSDLEALLTTSVATRHLFERHPTLASGYLLNWGGANLPVTFSAECFDAHPDTVRFLSYGSALLSEVLASVPTPAANPAGALARCATAGDWEVRGWYARDQDGDWSLVRNFPDLKKRLGSESPGAFQNDSSARTQFEQAMRDVQRQQAKIVRHRQMARYLAERVKAQRILVQAALVEIVLGRQREMFDAENYPAAFDATAIAGLQRHGFPWTALVALAFEPQIMLSENDPYYQQIASERRESLKARFSQLAGTARQAVNTLHPAQANAKSPHDVSQIEISVSLLGS